MGKITRFLDDDDQGADLIEYALLVGLVSLAAVAIVSPLGPSIRSMLNKISTTLGNINP